MFATINDTAARFAFGTLGAFVAAGLCLGAATAPANAAEAPRTQAVSYKDLDLSKAQGRHALEARIKGAARSVCAANSDDLQERISQNICVRNAVGNAQSKAYAAAASNQG